MTTLQYALKDYFIVRRWFLHHVLLGLVVGLVVGATVMWFVTDRYFDNTVEATVGVGGGLDTAGEGYVQSTSTQTLESSKTTTTQIQPKSIPTKTR